MPSAAAPATFHPVADVAAATAADGAPTRSPQQCAPAPRLGAGRLTITLLIVGLPVLALVAVCTDLLSGTATALNISLLVGLYVVTGLGITAGYHRLFTHRSFTAKAPLRLALAIAGGMSFEGGVISWVATHRRHHAFTDAPGDPHSPHEFGAGGWDQLRGAVHAHLGWLFRVDTTSIDRYAPDLPKDRMLAAVDRAFPLLCLVSLAIPTLIGYAFTGTAEGALTALLWGGLIRVFVLHHVTWSVNSLCHLFGSRPFRTKGTDRATNLWPLALISFGDSFHNLHHSDPTSARHGVDRGQVDLAAGFIRGCEKAGWATDVRWPTPDRLAARRVCSDGASNEARPPRSHGQRP